MAKKDLKKAKDLAFGGALALQSTNVLTDRSIGGLTNTATGFVGIGIAGATANVAEGMIKKKRRKRK